MLSSTSSFDGPYSPASSGLGRAIVFCVGVGASFLALTGLHEAILRRVGHVTAVVDDESLWCVARSRVESLGEQDVLLLGASRMQTDIDEATFAKAFPNSQIVNLAISGGGTSWPVFQDIVRHTAFAGTIILDETEWTMAHSSTLQQSFVNAFRHTFSIDDSINRRIATWLQRRLVCLAPGESSTEIWPRMLVGRRLPNVKAVVTTPHRFARSDYTRMDPAFLRAILQRRLAEGASVSQELANTVDAAVARWGDLVEEFRGRGGRVVFVRLPVSQELWAVENADDAALRGWRQIMDRLGVVAIICNGAEHGIVDDLRILDYSHIQAADTGRFTKWLCERLQELIGRESNYR